MADTVGEAAWIARLDDLKSAAADLEKRVELVELYQQALAAEPYSLSLWLAYCEFVWSLYHGCQAGADGWSEEERVLGEELFPLDMALDAWLQGASATKLRLNDSSRLWDRWIEIELDELEKTTNDDRIDRVRQLFLERLSTPHRRWDETSQKFSEYLTKYDEENWEATMVQMTALAQRAKDIYSAREVFEIRLQDAINSNDYDATWAAARSYLDWEGNQLKKKGQSTWAICVALYERILLLFPDSAGLWEEYVALVGTQHSIRKTVLPQSPELLPLFQRATSHCPWSGALWARYILQAEIDGLSFTEIEQVKHSATDRIPSDGLGDVIQVYAAWCGYLQRRALAENAEEDDVDLADVGFSSALESIQDLGEKIYGKEFQGDPTYRIERQLVRYLSERGASEEARGLWKKLSKTRGDGYEFWQLWYSWEMRDWERNASREHNVSSRPPPTAATAVLSQALLRKKLDWPEKILEMLMQHANEYETAEELSHCLDTIHRVSKGVAKQRNREAADAVSAPLPQQNEATHDDSAQVATKRKRDDEPEDESTAKKRKEDDTTDAATLQKRDRENTTAIVSNLPREITQTKVRQFFKGYGHINSLSVHPQEDEQSALALVEFRTTDDLSTALVRDGKYLGDRQVRIEPGAGLTVYVTNFPPTADEAYIRELFQHCGRLLSVRWPSLKYNTHRRFCYASFQTNAAATKATALNGTMLDGRYKLEVKFSDPGKKKAREGAMNEGRELHVGNIEKSTTDEELRDIFAKFGTVESVRILKTANGRSKGAGFVVFEKKGEAEEALQLDKTHYKGHILSVELSKHANYKPIAVSSGIHEATISTDGHSPHSEASTTEPSRDNVASRTIALMDIPDTVNDARIRSVAESYGEIVKVVLRPDHQGAIIEYATVGSSGKATLGLENLEIIPGRHVRTGSVKELLQEKSELKTDGLPSRPGKGASKASFIKPPAPVSRPGPRGGRGVKRGVGFAAAGRRPAASSSYKAADDERDGGEKGATKSNADFRALLSGGGS